MTTHEIFLEQIKADPADDAARLVYADWLVEQDDPRGLYLQQEVRLAQMKASDPRYPALEHQLQALREHIDPQWLARAGKRFDVHLKDLGDWKQATNLVAKLFRWFSPSKDPGDLSRRLAEQVSPIGQGLLRPSAEKLRNYIQKGSIEVELRPSILPPALGFAGTSLFPVDTDDVMEDEVLAGAETGNASPGAFENHDSSER